MALFQRHTNSEVNIPSYTISSIDKTILIVGLGNPGKEHDGTRHNIGFEVLDQFAKNNDFPDWTLKKDLKILASCELPSLCCISLYIRV